MRHGARTNAGKRLKGSLTGPTAQKPGRLPPFAEYEAPDDYLRSKSADELASMATRDAVNELERRHRDADGIKFAWKESGRYSEGYRVKPGRSSPSFSGTRNTPGRNARARANSNVFEGDSMSVSARPNYAEFQRNVEVSPEYEEIIRSYIRFASKSLNTRLDELKAKAEIAYAERDRVGGLRMLDAIKTHRIWATKGNLSAVFDVIPNVMPGEPPEHVYKQDVWEKKWTPLIWSIPREQDTIEVFVAAANGRKSSKRKSRAPRRSR